MWFGYSEENTWYPLNVKRVNEILLMNREGKKPASLDKDMVEEKIPLETLNSDLQRMDQKYKNKSKKKKKKKKGPDAGGAGGGNNAGTENRQRPNPRPNQKPPQRPNQTNRAIRDEILRGTFIGRDLLHGL
jgi:hypothetical protein